MVLAARTPEAAVGLDEVELPSVVLLASSSVFQFALVSVANSAAELSSVAWIAAPLISTLQPGSAIVEPVGLRIAFIALIWVCVALSTKRT